jgi:hypothetical protein
MEALNDRRSWYIADPNEGIPLDAIEPLSSRAYSLITRSQSPILHAHFMQIGGVVSILSGLTYHHDNFVSYQTKLERKFHNEYAPLRHEAVAWVNRVGQLHYFVISNLVKSRLGSVSVPTIESVMPFRNKHVAHRSVDAPMPEDSIAAQVMHAMSLSDIGGMLWTPKPGAAPADIASGPPVDTHYASFQIRGKGNNVYDLSVERDHPGVLREGYDVLSQLLV